MHYEMGGEITLIWLIHSPWPIYAMQNYKDFVRKGVREEIHKLLQSQQQSLFLGYSHFFLQLGAGGEKKKKKNEKKKNPERKMYRNSLLKLKAAGMEEHCFFVTV